MPKLTQEDIKLAQRALNYLSGTTMKADGQIGPQSIKIIKEFQFANELDVTGALDDDTWGLLEGTINSRFLRRMDFVNKAKAMGVPPSMVLAVTDLESIGAGFFESGQCIILFERHKFYQYAKQRYGERQAEAWRKKYPNICHPVWDKTAYAGGVREWDRYMIAAGLDGLCAAFATSWGYYQIMGFNYSIAGFSEISDFVNAMNVSEHTQLEAFLNFVKNQPSLWNALKTRNYAAFSLGYNGKRYKENQYDTRLRAADMRYAQYNQM